MSSGFLIAKKSSAYLEHHSIKKSLDMTASLGIICCVAYLDVTDFNPLPHQICVQFRQGASPQFQ